ncbi:asparagine synthase-related protein [Mycolicibacterium sp.]|uniref:asparagine synthase-related protein n=1 Tax=Mycolicibacterium sp. TaxID=2320850 RepID=UPI003D09EC89
MTSHTLDGFLVSLAPARLRGWPAPETVGDSSVWWHGYLAHPATLHTELGLPATASIGRIVEAGWRRWGTAIADHLTGEYAAVVLDARGAAIVGDRMGLRPIYYTCGPDGAAVSTDLGALARETGAWREVDDDYLADLFGTGLHLGSRTPYRRIRRLRMGEVATWRGGRLTVAGGWRPRVDPAAGSFDEHQERLRDTVRAAVAGALPSGAPAVELSGGLDTSTVLAVAAGLAPVQAFSFVHPGDPAGDETPWIRAALEATPTPWHPIDATAHATLGAGPELGAFVAAPARRIINGAPTAADGAGVARLGLSTILTGEGGDAVFFAGLLPWYLADLLRTGRLDRLRRESLRWGSHAQPRRSAAFWIRRAAVGGWWRWRRGQALTLEPFRPLAVSAPWLSPGYVTSRHLDRRPTAGVTVRAASVHGQAVLENIARGAEFARSRHVIASPGVEFRHPLLHPAVVDLALSTPWPVAVDPRIDRAVQRYAFAGTVSQTVLRRRSKPLADHAILRGFERHPAWREYLRDNPEVVRRGYVDAATWDAAVRDVGRIGGVTQLYSAIQIEVWLRHLHHAGAPTLLR